MKKSECRNAEGSTLPATLSITAKGILPRSKTGRTNYPDHLASRPKIGPANVMRFIRISFNAEESIFEPEVLPEGFTFKQIEYGFQLFDPENVFTLLESPGGGRTEMILVYTQIDGGNKLLGRGSICWDSKPEKWAEDLINKEFISWDSATDISLALNEIAPVQDQKTLPSENKLGEVMRQSLIKMEFQINLTPLLKDHIELIQQLLQELIKEKKFATYKDLGGRMGLLAGHRSLVRALIIIGVRGRLSGLPVSTAVLYSPNSLNKGLPADSFFALFTAQELSRIEKYSIWMEELRRLGYTCLPDGRPIPLLSHSPNRSPKR